jgi:zinc D-Ala-D-Ala carboxypeptidase
MDAMTYSEPARTKTRRTRGTPFAALLVVIVAVAAALGQQSLASSSSRAASPEEGPGGEHPGALTSGNEHRGPPLASGSEHRGAAPPRSEPPGALPARSERRAAPARAHGAVRGGTTVFDDGVPGVANLDPSLLAALRQAATDAAGDGVDFSVNSGWRSPEQQEQLLREAVSEHGSEKEAARWVATPGTSAHVSGKAVDVGFAATAWLSRHGARYGLCQIYSNEPWHYELRPEAIDRGCPPMYADPTHDPRMQQ